MRVGTIVWRNYESGEDVSREADSLSDDAGMLTDTGGKDDCIEPTERCSERTHFAVDAIDV